MSTPVITAKWAGNFDCTVCRRKRLMAEEFSKSSIDKYRKTDGQEALRCKLCTAKQEQEKRAEANKKAGERTSNVVNKNGDNDNDNDNDDKRTCAGPCHKILSKDSYNRNQWSKPEGKSRCRECVERSVKEEATQQNTEKDGKIEKARKKVEDLKLSKKATVREIVAAESELAAVEAEKVTGLKPVRLGGRGRGTRSYGRGRGGGGRGSGRGTASSAGRSTRK